MSHKKLYVICLVIITTLMILPLALMGLQNNIMQTMKSPTFYIPTTLIAILSSLSLWFTLGMARPGFQPKKIFWFLIMSAPLVLILALNLLASPQLNIIHDYTKQLSFGHGCLYITALMALAPIIILTLISRSLFPFHPFKNAWMISLTSFLFASFTMQWHCANSHVCHLTLWHYGPIFVGSFLISLPLQYWICPTK